MRRQEGFTTIELMIALVIGLITTMAAFQALDRFSAVSATVTSRTDNAQKGRLEMDGLVRALRSQACVGPGKPSLIAGNATSITFVTDLGDGTKPPERRTVIYDATTRQLRETRNAATSLAIPLAFSAATTSGPRLRDVDPEAPGAPIFRYFGYDLQDPPRPEAALDMNVSANLAKVAKITVAFRVGAAAGRRDSGAGATLQDEILLRSVDPADPVPVPLCS